MEYQYYRELAQVGHRKAIGIRFAPRSVRRSSYGVSHRIICAVGVGVPGVGSHLAIFLTPEEEASISPSQNKSLRSLCPASVSVPNVFHRFIDLLNMRSRGPSKHVKRIVHIGGRPHAIEHARDSRGAREYPQCLSRERLMASGFGQERIDDPRNDRRLLATLQRGFSTQLSQQSEQLG